MNLPESLGKSEGFVAGALILSALATGALALHYIDGGIWQTTVIGVWGSVVGGGALAAYRK